MKIAIIGAGAMGTAFGMFLAKAGEDVCFVDIRRDHIENIKKNGLIVKGEDKEEVVPIKAALTPEEASKELGGTADVILIFVKTPMNEVALKGAAPLIGANTYLATTQNGVGSEEMLAKFVARDHVIFGTTALSATVEVPGELRYVKRPMWSTYFMPLEGSMNAVCQQLCDSLTKGGQPAHADMTTQKHQWQKVVVNCAANAVSALLRLKSDVIFSDPSGKALGDIIANEVLAVAQAKGIDLTYDDVAAQLAFSAKLPAYPSMGLDAIHHRVTEIGTLNGAIAGLGKELGIATPANEVIYHLVKVMEDHYDQLPEGY